ncbi:hypothetical protein AB4Z51_43550 [Bradyrhizobium sp. 2TAF36]|uniref:hypothetical protein n=1 Tax=Bradyrhizobium sp. 2TAF36 TaxID=3233016 RepID=UPI003F93AA61
MARVARLYGSRPEIFTAVGWNALAELSSPSTPESVRLEIEARIMAGARARGTGVIGARNKARSASRKGRLLARNRTKRIVLAKIMEKACDGAPHCAPNERISDFD